jgi:hypothetical protein
MMNIFSYGITKERLKQKRISQETAALLAFYPGKKLFSAKEIIDFNAAYVLLCEMSKGRMERGLV